MVGDVERQAQRAAAELLGRGGGRRGVDVADRHAAALARERGRERLADATTAAGDDGDLAVERARLRGHEVGMPPGERNVSESTR